MGIFGAAHGLGGGQFSSEKNEVRGTWHYQLLTLSKRKPALYKVHTKRAFTLKSSEVSDYFNHGLYNWKQYSCDIARLTDINICMLNLLLKECPKTFYSVLWPRKTF